MTLLPHSSGYYSGIDGLRAVAVLAVVIFHLNAHWLPGGFVGVDVFFVISGFVVSLSLVGMRFSGFSQLLTYFYARRLLRIAPALIVCLLLVTLLCCMFIPKAWLSQANSRTGLAAFFGVSNFVLAATANDYFSPRSEFNPFTHTWSLAVEEQFYLVFPVLIFGWLRVTQDGKQSLRKVSGAALLFLGLASLALCAWWSVSQPTLAFYMLPARFWELAGGVGLVFTMGWWQPRLQALAPPITRAASAALLLALALGLVFAKDTAFPFPWAVLPALATMGLLCLLGAQPRSMAAQWLSVAPMRHVGRISYSLYLWHWPVFVLFRWTVGLEAVQYQVAAVAMALVLSELSFRWVEQPARKSVPLAAWSRARVVGLGLGAVSVSCAVSLLMFANQNQLSLSVTRDVDTWNPESNIQLSTSAPKGADCEVSARADTSAQSEGVVQLLMPSNCKGRAAGTGVGSSTGTGTSTSTSTSSTPRRMFVAGDSHAWAYTAMLRLYAQQSGTEIHLITRGGCPFFNLRRLNNAESAFCGDFTLKALRVIAAQAKQGDVLFLPTLRLVRLRDQWGEVQKVAASASASGSTASAGADEARSAAVSEAVAALEPLAKRGVLVVFEAPKPIFKSPAFRCSDWFNASNPACRGGLTIGRSELEAMRRPTQTAMRAVVQQLPQASVWDPTPVLCPEATCSTQRDGRPLFFDGDHISGNGNAFLLPDFAKFMAGVTTGR
jgi:peptidoglycan/LPS O-acetylase OafA/YrhL